MGADGAQVDYRGEEGVADEEDGDYWDGGARFVGRPEALVGREEWAGGGGVAEVECEEGG